VAARVEEDRTMSSAPDPALAAGADRDAVARLYEDLAANDLEALWRINARIMPFQPQPRTRLWRWRYKTLLHLAERAGELVPIGRGGDRRVLACINPGLKEAYGDQVYGATHSLWAALQYLGPHESAPGHRHSPSALRFVVQGNGAWTTVDGERCLMTPGDLVVTPAYAWHDHANDTDEAMVWFDGLDLPLAAYLDAQFLEFPDGDATQEVLDTHASERTYRSAGLLPTAVPPVVAGAGASPPPDGAVVGPRTPILRYPWERTAEAFDALGEDAWDPHDGIRLRYTDPRTGGPVMPTLDAVLQRFPAGRGTLPSRHVHSAVVQVFRGTGHSVVDGVRVDWEPGDIIALPPWAPYEHHAGDEDVLLFSITDEPVVRALGLERVARADAPQDVVRSFAEA
jgi:gentisate 1,2-dioxygenase